MKLSAFVPLLLVGAAACGSADKAESPKVDWPSFTNSYIEAQFKADPYFAVYQGRHEYDGQLPDWSDTALKAEIARLKSVLAETSAIDAAGLSDAEKFERNYLIAETKKRLFWLIQPISRIATSPGTPAMGLTPMSTSRGLTHRPMFE